MIREGVRMSEKPKDDSPDVSSYANRDKYGIFIDEAKISGVETVDTGSSWPPQFKAVRRRGGLNVMPRGSWDQD